MARIYEPAEDSYLLQKYVKKYAEGKVLDIGTGSGIQAKTALQKGLKVIAADINPEAVIYARKKGINTVLSDLFSNLHGKFDTIIFNPPYLPEDKYEDEESKIATTGGKKGHEIIERFLRDAKNHLSKNGIILIVSSNLTGDIERIFKKCGYSYEVLERKKIFFEILSVYKLKQIHKIHKKTNIKKAVAQTKAVDNRRSNQ